MCPIRAGLFVVDPDGMGAARYLPRRGGRRHGPVPVSYTHLDVYKRQMVMLTLQLFIIDLMSLVLDL